MGKLLVNGNVQATSFLGNLDWSYLTNKPSTFTPSSHTHSYIEPKGIYTFTSSTLPNSFDFGISAGFVNSDSGFGSFGSVLTIRTYSGGGGTLQLYAPYSPTYGGTHLKARFGNYDSSGGNSWTSLKEIAWLGDIPTKISQLTNDASGTWGISISGNAATASSASWASGASYAQRVAGSYTGNGGAQGPSYIGRGNVKFNMMNQFPNAGTTNYMDCILMNTYGGGDVPRATAFGIERYTGRAWIAEGSDTSSTWERVYEVISTRNIASQSVNYASSAGNADTVDGWHADGFLQKHGWWSSGGSYSVDNLTSGIVFAYTNHGAPASWGHTIAFTSGGNNSYICQLHATGTNRLFMRNKSSDYGQKGWTELLTDSNYSWWCLPLSGGTLSGLLTFNMNSMNVSIGQQNSSHFHFIVNSGSNFQSFYFNRNVVVDGALGIYQMNSNGCGSSFPSSPAKGQIFFKI